MRPRFAGHSLPPAYGERRETLLANPAAGKDLRFTLPAGGWYLLDSLRFVLTTSAQVATRVPWFSVKDGDGNLVWQSGTATGIAAGTTARYNFAPGLGLQFAGAVNIGTFPIPEVLLPAGWSIGSEVFVIQTEDQISQAVLVAQEFYDYDPNRAAGRGHEHERHHHLAAALAEYLDGHYAPAPRG